MKLLHIDNKVDMVINENKNEIILRPVKEIREGWEEQFKIMNENNDDALIINDTIDLDNTDWVW